MAIPKLSQENVADVLRMAGEGHGADAISSWLKSERGIDISSRCVRKRIAGIRDERREATQAAAQVTLGKVVMSDLEVLGKERRRARKMVSALFKQATKASGYIDPESAELYLKALDRLAKLIDMRLHYAGVDGERSKPKGALSIDMQLPADAAARAEVLRALADHEEGR